MKDQQPEPSIPEEVEASTTTTTSGSGSGSASGSGSTATETGQTQASSSSTPKPCASCYKPTETLKSCSKCQSVAYCSRDCQKADFKTHKKNCAKAAQLYAATADLKPAKPRGPPKDGFRGGLQKWQFDT